MLESIHSPRDVRSVPEERLPELAEEIRSSLIEKVSRTGGHLGPNLGVVELTIAIHRTFDSPRDVIVWDTGHQSYVHKMLTGRADAFDTLRQAGGLSGYPSRSESEHDVVENSHASGALAWANGIAIGIQQAGELGDRHVIAVVGDGALTGGMAWEALNNIAAAPERPLVIVVNDNERSYSPTIGGLAHHLATLRTTGGYERFLDWGKRTLGRTPVVGSPVYEALHGMKKGLKDIVAPQGMFEDLGLKYVGPVDGHDVAQLEHAFARARAFGGPVIVHVITEKGRGHQPALDDDAERFHAVGVVDPDTGKPLTSSGPTWTSTFADHLVDIGSRRPDVVAITAAMLGPTGLTRFQQEFPTRTIDVGIAEQYAVAAAAGMAYAGVHPVVAVYATFLNRAFDQVLLDCALHRAGVTFVLDRAGVTGDDGASHNGVWDMSILQVVPGIRVAAPRDGARLRELLDEAVAVDDAPTVVRFPKGALPADVHEIDREGQLDVLYREGAEDTLIVSVGALAGLALEVADRLGDQGIGATVVDPRWVIPVPDGLPELARRFRLVVTIEDNGRSAGVGSAVSQAMRDAGVFTPALDIGVPREFPAHGKRPEVMARMGLTAQDVARQIVGTVSSLTASTQLQVPGNVNP